MILRLALGCAGHDGVADRGAKVEEELSANCAGRRSIPSCLSNIEGRTMIMSAQSRLYEWFVYPFREKVCRETG